MIRPPHYTMLKKVVPEQDVERPGAIGENSPAASSGDLPGRGLIDVDVGKPRTSPPLSDGGSKTDGPGGDGAPSPTPNDSASMSANIKPLSASAEEEDKEKAIDRADSHTLLASALDQNPGSRRYIALAPMVPSASGQDSTPEES